MGYAPAGRRGGAVGGVPSGRARPPPGSTPSPGAPAWADGASAAPPPSNRPERIRPASPKDPASVPHRSHHAHAARRTSVGPPPGRPKPAAADQPRRGLILTVCWAERFRNPGSGEKLAVEKRDRGRFFEGKGERRVWGGGGGRFQAARKAAPRRWRRGPLSAGGKPSLVFMIRLAGSVKLT